MLNANEHSAVVRDWLEQNAEGLPPPQLIALFERAWDALWRRAELALGDITAKAAAQRVPANATARFPSLSPLALKARTLAFVRFAEVGPNNDELRKALGFLLSESLSLIGHLSGEILTPALHAELAHSSSSRTNRPVAAEPAGRTIMSDKVSLQSITTGVRNLDAVLGGGLPKGTLAVIAGPPGSGKTTLAQQICFHHASPGDRTLHISTLSEAPAKIMLYMQQFDYFDARKLADSIQLLDIGKTLREQNIDHAYEAVMAAVEKARPSLMVIDTFRGFETVARSIRELRKFVFDLAAGLLAWECTTLLVGEYGREDVASNPLFSVADGLIMLSQRDVSGEAQRFIEVLKLRGMAHSPDPHPFEITTRGIEIFAPRITILRRPRLEKERERLKLGISKLDELTGAGISRGSSVLVSGVSGTGKTVLLLEALYRGALTGRKGLFISFEETPERLRDTARGLGWDFDAQLERGMIEIVFVPQPDIRVEKNLLMIHERIGSMKPALVGIDSLSVFLNKIADPTVVREKTFQLAAVIEEANAVGFFATDIPYGTERISRMGVEETVVDGVIILSAIQDGLERHRQIEIYKLRSTAHLLGRHAMVIEKGGIAIFPRYNAEPRFLAPPPALQVARRVSSGVPGLDELLGGGLLDRSATIVSGSSGIGKSTIALQFIHEGGKAGEKGIYVTLEEGPEQILAVADALRIPLREMARKGLIGILYFSPERIRAAQFLTILTDKIQELKASRLVVDSTSNIAVAGDGIKEAQQLLYSLVVRAKTLGTTSLMTLDSDSLHSTELTAERDVMGVADNLIMLRYAQADGNTPLLTVVKTRGSAHAQECHSFSIGKGGARIGPARHARAGAEHALS